MTSTIRLLFLSFLITISFTVSFSQKPPMKYGKVDMADMEMTVYDKDSTAEAVVLADYGTSKFKYDNDKGWQILFEHHKRIKILKKEGYSFADVSIDYYDPGHGNKEKIIGLKGATYNLENGKVEKYKLSNNAEFDEVKNKFWQRKKFTLPQVKEGSVIEYSYTLVSDYTRFLREWQFQNIIPVKWSEYIVTIPEFFDYQFMTQGYEPMAINETKQLVERFQYKWESEVQAGGRIDKGTGTLESNSKVTRIATENMPTFDIEPYISNYENYLSKISFELRSIRYRNQSPTIIMGTWDKLNQEFLEHESFGKKIAGSNYLDKNLETILDGTENSQEIISKVYNYVKKNVSWNGSNGRYLSGKGFREVLSDKKGSAADINLLLTTLLAKAGLQAEGVLISTRNNGFIRTQYAISGQFNYVICIVEIDGKNILLDATDPYLPIGLLPERCLNEKGWVVSATSPRWIDIKVTNKRVEKIVGTLTLNENGEFSGELENHYQGYSARSPRKVYFTKGKEDYVNDIKSKSGWEINALEIENEKELLKPFIEKYDLTLDSEAESLGAQIYFNPLLGNQMTTNPFKLEERKYPVDFACPKEEMYYITYTIPEGYHVEESPEPVILSLPEKAGRYLYNVSILGNKMMVTSKLNIYKTLFLPSDYPNVKEFYARVVAKQNEQIVLKKD